jgi:hypothetical protein
LTISPTALTTSHTAAAASAAAIVSLSVLSSHHRIYSMNSYYSPIIWIHTPTLTYEFISFITPLDHMNSYPSSMIRIHIQLYHMNSYFSSMIWIHIRMLQSIPTTRTILQAASSIPENCMITSVNNLLRLTSDLNSWTSKLVITHGDQSIDVSSAAQGSLSSSPIGIYPHKKIFHIPAQSFFWWK